MSYLIVLLSVGIVILAHEIGHFAGARAAGIPVRVFSLGFGPKLWSVTRGVTEYRVSLIPIGGYVLPAVDDEKEFFRYSAGARMLLAAGGPLASVVFPVACFMLFNVLKHGASITGILVTPFAQTAAILYKMVITLPAVFSHGGNVSGIIGIVAEGSRFVGPEAANIVYFMAVISLNLALLNLLPVPALDGGKILLYALEKVHVKFAKLHLPLAIAGWVLILGLLLYTTWADIGRYVLGS